MSYRYILILGKESDRASRELADAPESDLRELTFGTSTLERVRLFVSTETPTIRLGEQGVLIGHLFSPDGSPVVDAGSPTWPTNNASAEHLLQSGYWGEYLLILPGTGDGQDVTILRDPSGGMPCFYSIVDGSGFITSSISIAERLGLYHRRINWDSIAHALTYPYLRRQRTGLVNIHELLPGCSLDTGTSGTTVTTAWSPWEFVTAGVRYGEPGIAAANIGHAVRTVVRAWAETDENVILELSGGLDSSIVAASLRDVKAFVTCCTITAPIPGTDERHYARKMTDALGVELRSVEIDYEQARYDFAPPRDAVVPGMGVLHYAVDEAMERAADAYGSAAYFSGAGGDSIFCYLKGASPAADAFRERGLLAGVAAIRDLSTLHRCTLWKAGRLTLRKLRRGAKPPWPIDTTFLNRERAAREIENHPWFDIPIDALAGDREKICDLIGSQSYRDGMTRTARRPMRFPLLAQPVLEACLKVPTWMWLSGGHDRVVARSAFADVLPPEILHRRSKGSYVNYCGAVYKRCKNGMQQFLMTGLLQSEGLLDSDSLKRFFESDLPPEDLSFMRIFDLCMIENWVRHQTS